MFWFTIPLTLTFCLKYLFFALSKMMLPAKSSIMNDMESMALIVPSIYLLFCWCPFTRFTCATLVEGLVQLKCLFHYYCNKSDFVFILLDRCVICMTDFAMGDPIRFLPCMHIYHKDCIEDWLVRSFTCPSCMEPVEAALLSTYYEATTE